MSASTRGLDGGNVDLLHRHHRLEGTLCLTATSRREFYGAVSADRKIVKGILITTSGFTDQAKTFAQEVGIELIDMEQLGRLLAQQGTNSASQNAEQPLIRKLPKLF